MGESLSKQKRRRKEEKISLEIDYAISTGNVEKLNKILRKSNDLIFDQSHWPSSLLHQAAKAEKLEVVKLLLDTARSKFSSTREIFTKAFPNELCTKNGLYETPITLAIKHHNLDIVEFLLAELYMNASAEDMGFPLHTALSANNFDVIKLILEHHPEIVNVPDAKGIYPIAIAAQFFDRHPLFCLDVIKWNNILDLMIDSGADFYVPSLRYDMPVLHYIASNWNLSLAPCVLRKLLDINGVDSKGRTALSMAASHGMKENVQGLLSRSANIGIADNNGVFPLTIAVEHGHFDIMKLLANVTLKAVENQAVEKAVKHRKYNCLEYLLSMGFAAPNNIEKVFTISEILDGSTQDFSHTIKVLFENGASFGEFTNLEYFFTMKIFGKMHLNSFSCLLDSGLVEIQAECDYTNFSKICDVIMKFYATFVSSEDDEAEFAVDEERNKRFNFAKKFALYFEYFPFAKFSVSTETVSRMMNPPASLEPIVFYSSQPKTIIRTVSMLTQICKWNIRCRIALRHGRVPRECVITLPLPDTLKNFIFPDRSEELRKLRLSDAKMLLRNFLAHL